MKIRVQISVLVQEPSPQEQLINSKCHDNFIQEIIQDEDQQMKIGQINVSKCS